VGGYFGGRLAQAGEDVTFIARGEHLRAMQAHGLQVESIQGDFTIDPVQATDDPAEVGEVDAVLVAVKAWQVPEAAHAVQPMVGPDTFVVPLENGVEAPGQLAEVLGAQHVLGGLCRIFSAIVTPGHISHAGGEPSIAFGELDNRPSERAQRLQHAFERADGVKAEIPADIQAALWEKFVFVASLGGIGAVTRAPVGVVRELPETRYLLQTAVGEIITLARALEIDLSMDLVERTLSAFDGLPADATPSMQRDIMEGNPSELEAQSGAVVRLARETGVPTPVHDFIYRTQLPSELRARGELEFG
jgi:2-dehydropantoate 2-reductase